jgi:hypothetical protein
MISSEKSATFRDHAFPSENATNAKMLERFLFPVISVKPL